MQHPATNIAALLDSRSPVDYAYVTASFQPYQPKRYEVALIIADCRALGTGSMPPSWLWSPRSLLQRWGKETISCTDDVRENR